MKFEIPDKPNEEIDRFIIAKTRAFNDRFVPDDFTPLSVYCHNDQGHIVGGLTGKTYWNYLDVEFLWVDDAHRKEGLASKILSMAEREAKERGCTCSMLDTYEFQALGFYLKQGYEEFGSLEGYAGKFERYYLRKSL